MAKFDFVRKEGDLALFRWSGASGESLVFGLLRGVAGAQPEPMTLKAFWGGKNASAILIAPSEPQGDLSDWAAYINYPVQAIFNLIAWLESPATVPPPKPDTNFRCVAVNRSNNQINTQLTNPSGFNLGVLQVTVNSSGSSNPAQAVWNYDAATLTFISTFFLALRLDNTQSPSPTSLTSTAPITMTLNGDNAGAVIFNLVNLDPYNLFGVLSGDQPPAKPRPMPEIRYFHPGGKLSFPMAKPISVRNLLTLDVSFNPALPFSPSHTFFLPDLSQPLMADLFTCNTVTQTNGNGATLVPTAGFGFHLARTPKYLSSNSPWRSFYPAPSGPMTVKTGGAIKLMCGLSGLEYLQLKAGDSVNLVPAQKAYAPNFVPPSMGGGQSTPAPASDEALSDLGQTSWLSIHTPSAYYTQADVEPFFAANVIPNTTYPSAVSSYLSDPNNVGGAIAVFPFAAHASVYDKSNSNPQAPPELFSAYEAQVLVPHRYQALVPQGTVPVFQNHDQASLSGSGAATPTGFIAGLNPQPGTVAKAKRKMKSGATMSDEPVPPPAGTWSQLTLARHKESGKDQSLSFLAKDGGTVYPPLVQGLLHSKVFLVTNNWDALGPMQSELVVDGFAFHVKPVVPKEAYKTIAVFKFQTTASLEALVQTSSVWFRPDLFVSRDGDGIKGVQDAINQAINVAKGTEGKPTDPFGYFRDTIASDPSWTGVVFFHVPIDGGNMPPDLQILFAGIDGELYAHHFGIDLNHLALDVKGNPQLNQSSLFGVIHYQGKPPKDATQPGGDTDASPFAFTLLDMTVEIENSVVTDFDALVAITIPELFGRQVSFTDPDIKWLIEQFPQLEPTLEGLVNTLIIQGVYQQQGEVGTVSFQRTDPLSIFTLKDGGSLRVVDQFQVTTSVLAPIASPPPAKDQDQLIQARFSMGGQLIFSADPFGVTDPADLFSFGNVVGGVMTGLDLENLGLMISFKLDANGARVPNSETITADYAHIQVSQSQGGVRDKSLLASFPIKITRFMHDEKGLTESSLAASQMTVVNLSGHDDGTPTFALVGDLPLGSMGFLAGAHADISSKLVLAWGPSAATPDNDSAQVLVSLLNLSVDVKGFDLEGIVKVGYKEANLIRVPVSAGDDVYVALFNNVALKVLGFTFPPNVLANFLLMAGTDDSAHQNVAWYLAAAQTSCGGS